LLADLGKKAYNLIMKKGGFDLKKGPDSWFNIGGG
jgi:hypothetical protein